MGGRMRRCRRYLGLGGLLGQFREIARHLLLVRLQLGDAGLQRFDLLVRIGKLARHRLQLLGRI